MRKVDRMFGSGRYVVAGLIPAILLSACSGSSPSVGASQTPTQAAAATAKPTLGPLALKIQRYPANFASWSGVVADATGIFKKNGVNATFEVVNTGALASAALVSGSVDLAILDSALAGPLVSKGENLKILAGTVRMSWHLLSVPATPITAAKFPDTIKQLKGKKIGITALGSASHFLGIAILRAAGMSENDVTLVPAGGVPQLVAAMQSGQVDAGVVTEEMKFTLGALKPRDLVDLASASSELAVAPDLAALAGVPHTSYWARGDWVSGNQEVVKRFERSIAQATVWMQDSKNRAGLVKIIKDFGAPAGIDVDAYVAAMLPVLVGHMEPDGLNALQKFNITYGIATKALTAKELLDPGCPTSEDALRKLAAENP